MNSATAVPAHLLPDQQDAAPDDLKRTGILDVFSADPRPTFILSLEDLRAGIWRPVFANAACATALSSTFVVRDDDATGPFRTWAESDAALSLPTYRHHGKLWTAFDLRDQWRVVGGTRTSFEDEVSTEAAPVPGKHVPSLSDSTRTSDPDFRSSPVTSPVTSVFGGAVMPHEEDSWADQMPEQPYINNVFKAVDWASTPLGSLRNWPYLLRRSTRFVLADPTPATLFWGDNEACVFNAGYAEILQDRQFSSLGRPASEVWGEIYEKLKPYINEVKKTRTSCSWRNIQFIITRKDGRIEETFWDWSLIPLMEHKARNSGVYSSVHETTRQYLSDRRQDTMLASTHSRDALSFWNQVLANFQKNPWDAPLAAFYDVSQNRRLSMSSDGSNDDPGYYVVRRGGIGLPTDNKIFPLSGDMKFSANSIMPYLAEAASQRESLILTEETHPAFFALLEGAQWVGFGVPSRTVVIFCLRLGNEIVGFIVLALNPRRPYDDDEHRFVASLDAQLSASLSAAVLIERAVQTEERLREQLKSRIIQLEMSDARYRAITQLNPLGTINLTPDGTAIYANQKWYEITGHPAEADVSGLTFRNVIYEEDLVVIEREFREMVVNKLQRAYEVRLKKTWYDDVDRTWRNRWILCTGGPECNENGEVVSIIGCISDITEQKHAIEIQSRHRQVAEEAKAAQERYMDITSHEMRNPLSAILQSADDILSSLKESVESSHNRITFAKAIVDSCRDAAEIISLCAQHQARIINDVLTLSKLDSKLLEVSPISAQPATVVRETLQMYAGELASNDIAFDFEVESSFGEHGVDWVYCDPARLKQILINLMGNAIKFTRTENVRKITVRLVASVEKPPRTNAHNIEWFPSKKLSSGRRRDVTSDPEWGQGDPVYIAIIVSDTGKGLSADEKKRLFHRFAQANTLTHVHYGGSGLGLFISRELTELQGGEIGVSTEVGKGSTFAFYIKGRKGAPAPDQQKIELKETSDQTRATVIDSGDMPSKNRGIVPLMASAPPSKEATPAKRTNLDILLVEDNVVNQRVMTKQLTKAGARVVIANHGQEALDHLEKTVLWGANNGSGETIDLALMDIEMPVMNGLTCARRIRELEKEGKLASHLPVVAVTANARKEQIDDCLGAGMDDFMIKPFRVPDLLAKVEKLMASREPKQTPS